MRKKGKTMFERIAKAASAARETVNGLRALAEYAQLNSPFLQWKNAYLKELQEVTNERDKLRADYESTGCIGREMDRLQTQVKRLIRANEDLKAKLEWLSRWRKQSETPCPFPELEAVEWCFRDDTLARGVSLVSSLLNPDKWRPTVDSLKIYDQYKDVR